MEPKNIKLLNLQQRDAQRNKKPICCERKQAVARICSWPKCTNQENQILCGVKACKCNTQVHNDCYNFINFQYVQNLVNEYQTISFTNIFKDILASLADIVRTSAKLYNEIVQNYYEIFMMPYPIKQIKKGMNDSGAINKEYSIPLQDFFNKYEDYNIPKLTENQNYKKNIGQIKENCTKFQKIIKEFDENLKKALNQNEKMGLDIIAKHNEKKQVNLSKNQPQKRGESKEKK